MGTVYRGRHRNTGRYEAIKILSPEYMEDERFKEFVERFELESRIGASLDHQNIVRVYDAGTGRFKGGEVSYIAMEYVQGGNLDKRIREKGPLSHDTAVEFTLQVAKGLQAAHASGIFHRDVKPHNILLTEAGEAKVADFGIAHVAFETRITPPGHHPGTTVYMSPEQVAGLKIDGRSDLYSLGVVLYEMLTNTRPSVADTEKGTETKILNERPSPPIEVNSNVPQWLNDVCVKLLEKDPEKRHENAADLITDLEKAEVPDLIRQTPDQARSTLAARGLSLGRRREIRNERIPKGRIIDQEPTPESIVSRGSSVSITVSSGRSIVEVPDLIGLNRSEVSGALEKVGLKLGNQAPIWNERIPEGEIVGQSPEAQTKVEAGSLVNVRVNLRPRVAVPDVSNMNIGEARQVIQDEGLLVADTQEKRSLKPRGTVISTVPPAGTEVPLGTSITPIISVGPSWWFLVAALIVISLLGGFVGVLLRYLIGV